MNRKQRQQERQNGRTRKFRDQMNRKGGYTKNRCYVSKFEKKGKSKVKERINEMHVEEKRGVAHENCGFGCDFLGDEGQGAKGT